MSLSFSLSSGELLITRGTTCMILSLLKATFSLCVFLGCLLFCHSFPLRIRLKRSKEVCGSPELFNHPASQLSRGAPQHHHNNYYYSQPTWREPVHAIINEECLSLCLFQFSNVSIPRTHLKQSHFYVKSKADVFRLSKMSDLKKILSLGHNLVW